MRKIFLAIIAVAFTFTFSPVLAEKLETGYHSFDGEAEFEDVEFNLENAIVNRGLVINYTGFLNAMLERTAEVTKDDASTYRSPYLNAIYLHFCSAALTHAAVEADIANIAICPYVMFAYELRSAPGTVTVGYRRPIASNSKASAKAYEDIEKLLIGIAKEALE
ncbi:MAG: DUF302 domain-containing protein [Rhizobiaceae bacterium]|nr:DUF302 domain-containing protein [Rhizobiaceae bacterium]